MFSYSSSDKFSSSLNYLTSNSECAVTKWCWTSTGWEISSLAKGVLGTYGGHGVSGRLAVPPYSSSN